MTRRAAVQAAAAWTQTPERGNYLLMRVMAGLSLAFGRTATRPLLYGVAAYFALFSLKGRAASRDYLNRALGRTARWTDIYRHYLTFASTIHDRIYLIRRQLHLFDVTVHGGELLTPILAQGHGLFLAGAHLGSFEAMSAAARGHDKLRAIMVMHEDNAQKINALLRAINPDVTHDVIALGKVDSMLLVAQRLDEGCAIGILADRTPVDDTQQSVSFLGAQARLPTGPFRMAALLKRPVIFMAGLYLGGNRYAIHLEALADFSTLSRAQQPAAIEAAIHRYAALMERYCRKAPYNWFNFFNFWDAAPRAAQP